MRLLLPVILSFFAACGSTAENNDAASTQNDTSMNTSPAVATADNSLSDAERTEGWQSLFDGQSKAGWHGYLKKDSDTAWKVQDGTLFLDVSGEGKHSGVDLVTDEEYTDFHFKTDWKISQAGNSGIMYGVKEDPKYEYTYYTGPEMQVLDNEGHADAKIHKHRSGDLYDLIPSSQETVKPYGEWNTAEIIKKDSVLELKLNGVSVVKTTLWDDSWKKLVAGSKFKKWPAFGAFNTGRIALQDHGNKVWFRNIKIRKL